MALLTAVDIANYFLIFVDRNEGDSITHLKLQKLLYFAQGVNLVLTGNSLFGEALKAWQHGPVSQSVYTQFKVFERNSIPQPGEIDFKNYDLHTKNLVYKVYSIYGEHTAAYLRDLSHNHLAWIQAYNSVDKTLDNAQIKKDFEDVVNPEDFVIKDEAIAKIEQAEDEWWMSYDCGVPSEDITDEIIRLAKDGNHVESSIL